MDGRLTDSGETQYAYDAAGRAVNVVSPETDVTLRQTQSFDGNGVRTKLMSQQEVSHEQTGTTSTDTKTQYFVSSIVLNSVITELDQSGAKTRTFVYQGGEALAWQQKSGSTETIAWEHRDPSQASVRGSTVAAELEPLGSNAGVFKGFVIPPPRSQQTLEAERSYPFFAATTSGQCVVDGIETPCSLTGGEGAVQCPPSGCRSLNLRTNQIEYFHAYADGNSGYMPAGAIYRGQGQWDAADDLDGGYLHETPDRFFEHWRNPQNTQMPLLAVEVDILHNDVQNLLNKKACSDFISAILQELKRITNKSIYDTTNAIDLFKAVVAEGGFFRGPLKDASAGGGQGLKGAVIVINQNAPHFSNLSDASSIISERRGSTLLHELMHVAGYSHLDMAMAAQNVARAQGYKNAGELPSRQDFEHGKKGEAEWDAANGWYFTTREQLACMGKGGYKEPLR